MALAPPLRAVPFNAVLRSNKSRNRHGPTPPGTACNAALATFARWPVQHRPPAHWRLRANFSNWGREGPKQSFRFAESLTRFVPTSITAPPGLIQSACNNPALPIAAYHNIARAPRLQIPFFGLRMANRHRRIRVHQQHQPSASPTDRSAQTIHHRVRRAFKIAISFRQQKISCTPAGVQAHHPRIPLTSFLPIHR